MINRMTQSLESAKTQKTQSVHLGCEEEHLLQHPVNFASGTFSQMPTHNSWALLQSAAERTTTNKNEQLNHEQAKLLQEWCERSAAGEWSAGFQPSVCAKNVKLRPRKVENSVTWIANRSTRRVGGSPTDAQQGEASDPRVTDSSSGSSMASDSARLPSDPRGAVGHSGGSLAADTTRSLFMCAPLPPKAFHCMHLCSHCRHNFCHFEVNHTILGYFTHSCWVCRNIIDPNIQLNHHDFACERADVEGNGVGGPSDVCNNVEVRNDGTEHGDDVFSMASDYLEQLEEADVQAIDKF